MGGFHKKISLKYFGHSCFLLMTKSGTRIIMDPFDEQVGYPLPAVEADVVTTSHGHYDHSNVSIIKGSFEHYSKPGEYTCKEVMIRGISTFHDNERGAKRGTNTVYIFEFYGLRVCHLGDLGHILTAEQVKDIGKIEILLLPVGGIYTIDAQAAVQVVKQINPAVTIPMHYKAPNLKFELNDVDTFIKKSGKGFNRVGNELELEHPRYLEGFTEIIIME